MGAMSAFTIGNHLHQPAAASSFVNSVDFSILMDAKSEVSRLEASVLLRSLNC